jgi:hypothetical protein
MVFLLVKLLEKFKSPPTSPRHPKLLVLLRQKNQSTEIKSFLLYFLPSGQLYRQYFSPQMESVQNQIFNLRQQTRVLIADLYRAGMDMDTFESVLLPMKDATPELPVSPTEEKKQKKVPRYQRPIHQGKSKIVSKPLNIVKKVQERIKLKVTVV